jgi:hypothetical protein
MRRKSSPAYRRPSTRRPGELTPGHRPRRLALNSRAAFAEKVTEMAKRPKALIPRLFASALVSVVLASATIAFAATKLPAPSPIAKPAAPEKPKPLRVPDVTGEAYVFAKGILEEAGFAWKVRGAEGFAVNIVGGQSPAAGSVAVDTGAPTITLTLRRNAGYPELGTPENSAPYAGSPLVLVGAEAKAPTKASKPALRGRKASPSR